MGHLVPEANNEVKFSVTGDGEIVATDNGDPTDFTSFGSVDRRAFNGLALVIVRITGANSRPVVVSARGYGVEIPMVIVTYLMCFCLLHD